MGQKNESSHIYHIGKKVFCQLPEGGTGRRVDQGDRPLQCSVAVVLSRRYGRKVRCGGGSADGRLCRPLADPYGNRDGVGSLLS